MSVVDEIRRRVDERLKELQPAIDEYHELMAVKNGLMETGVVSSGGSASQTKPAASGRQRTSTRRPRRTSSQRSGGRAEQALQIVSAKPGATVNEIAAEMGINQNYLYRLLPRMEREGRLRREGNGWAPPVGAA